MKGKHTPILVLLPIFLLVLYVYWSAFVQNVMVSQSTEAIPFGSTIQLGDDIQPVEGLAIFHFYDPSCMVARDNIEHLKQIFSRYDDRKAFWHIVYNKNTDTETLKRKLGFPVTLIEDFDGELASKFGVLSTPMLVIMDNEKLYFRGTYLKNGAFCGADDITSSDAGIAVMSSMKGNQLPLHLKDVRSYIGCAL